MQASFINDARQQQIRLDFEFQIRANTLVIKAQARDATYQSELAEHIDIDFNHICELLLTKEYHLVSKRSDTLRLTVAELDLEFTNTDKLLINQLGQRIAEQERQRLIIETELNMRGELLTLKDRDIETITDRLNETTEREQAARRQIDRINALNAQQIRRNQQLTQENLRLNQLQEEIRKDEEYKEKIFLSGRREVERLEESIHMKDRQILFHKHKLQQFKEKIDKLQNQIFLQQQFSTKEIQNQKSQIAELKSLLNQMQRDPQRKKSSSSRSISRGRISKKSSLIIETTSYNPFKNYYNSERNLTESQNLSTLPNQQLLNLISGQITQQLPTISQKILKKREHTPNPQIETRDSLKIRKREFSPERKHALSKQPQGKSVGICSKNCEIKNKRQNSNERSNSRSHKNSKSRSKGHKRDTSKDSLGRSSMNYNLASSRSNKRDDFKELKRQLGQEATIKPSNQEGYLRRMNVNQVAQKPRFEPVRKIEQSNKEKSFEDERKVCRSPLSKNASFNPPRSGTRFTNNVINQKKIQKNVKRI